jgi:hypothetical protein
MIRKLTTVVLSGILGTVLLAGDAKACLFKKCGGCARPAACAAPCAPACYTPAPCATSCGPKFKLCNFKLPSLCHRRPVATAVCATPVYYAPSYPVATPQTSAQH